MDETTATLDRSWHLKIGRAKEHFSVLDTEIKAWVLTNPVTITREKDRVGLRHSIFAEVINPPPLNRWSLVCGDLIHNLRSALDSILYGIAICETGVNPPADEEVLQFPITGSPPKFSKQKYRIKSLSPAVQAAIESVQPYNRPHPQHPPVLELLGYLNNFDKHRTINVIAAVPHDPSVEMDSSVASVTVYRTAVEGKTEILSFTLALPDPDFRYKFEAMIVIYIAHLPGPSKSPFSELASVLDSLIAEVEKVVDTLEAIVGEINIVQTPALSQAAHFVIDESRLS